MPLIADSGSTKTAWATAHGDAEPLITEGLNPHFTSDKAFLSVFDRLRAHFGRVGKLWFYGSGCGDERQASRIRDLALRSGLAAEAHIHTDLLGACRALFGHAAGYAGILGTGSNCCLYNGTAIVRSVPSGGYVVGDHGSANHVGRLLLQDHLAGLMPTPLAEAFRQAFPYSHAQWLDHLYHQPHPNRFLASLAPFATAHADHPYCDGLLRQAVASWFTYQLLPLMHGQGDTTHPQPGDTAPIPLGLVGSFAQAVRPLVEQCAATHGLHLAALLPNPLAALRAYHQTSPL